MTPQQTQSLIDFFKMTHFFTHKVQKTFTKNDNLRLAWTKQVIYDFFSVGIVYDTITHKNKLLLIDILFQIQGEQVTFMVPTWYFLST